MSNQLKIGEQLFKNIPKEKVPLWGALLLKEFKNILLEEPKEITELRYLINSEEWGKCYRQFSRIRSLKLNNKDKQKEIYLTLAERVSKIAYNQTEPKAPFDSESGFLIYNLATELAKLVNSKKRIEGILNLFQSKKNIDNFFAIETKKAGIKLLEKIFSSKEPEMQILRTELPKECQFDEISFSNSISHLYRGKNNFPNGSFEFKFDIICHNTKIGYYSLLWDNEIELIDDFLVLS